MIWREDSGRVEHILRQRGDLQTFRHSRRTDAQLSGDDARAADLLGAAFTISASGREFCLIDRTKLIFRLLLRLDNLLQLLRLEGHFVGRQPAPGGVLPGVDSFAGEVE